MPQFYFIVKWNYDTQLTAVYCIYSYEYKFHMKTYFGITLIYIHLQ